MYKRQQNKTKQIKTSQAKLVWISLVQYIHIYKRRQTKTKRISFVQHTYIYKRQQNKTKQIKTSQAKLVWISFAYALVWPMN